MLKLKRMQQGVIPFGSGWGTPGFVVEIEEDEKDIEVTEGKTPYMANADSLLLEITEAVKSNNWANLWTLELAGKARGASCYFAGNEWVAKENRGTCGEFFRLFSKVSVETQRMLAIQKMSEPYMGWIGTPQYYTGMDDFYQQFNHSVVDCPLSADYNQMAFMELKNHPFTRFYYSIEKSGDTKLIDQFYVEPGVLEGVSPVKVQLTAAPEAWNEAIEYALPRGYRVCPKRTVKDGFVEARSW